MLGQRVRGLAGQDLAGLGGRLQPGGGVHDRAGDEELPGGPAPVAASPDSMPTRTSSGSARPRAWPSRRRRSRIASPARTARSASSSCTVRQAEDRHDRVADELLRPAAQGLQLLGRGVEEPAEHLAGAFGVEALGEAGGVDQVGEQHRDHLALLGAERRADERRRSSGRTERPRGAARRRPGRACTQHMRLIRRRAGDTHPSFPCRQVQ